MALSADHYATLKVALDADIEVVKAAYRALMLKYHPDQNRDNPAALAQATRINAAYEILGDPCKRAAYDSDLASARFDGPPPTPDRASQAPPQRPFYDGGEPEHLRSAGRRVPKPSHLRDFLIGAIIWRAASVAGTMVVMTAGGLYLKHELSSMSQASGQQISGISQVLAGIGQPGAAAGSPHIIHIQPGEFGRSRAPGPLGWVQTQLATPHYSRKVINGVAVYRRDDPWSWLEARYSQISQWLRSPPKTRRFNEAGAIDRDS